MTEITDEIFNRENNHRLATHVSTAGATLYMNRSAIKKLICELERISDADPKECYEVHFGMFFSYFNTDEELIEPSVKFSDGLSDVFKTIVSESLNAKIKERLIDADATPPQFEVTIMHVSDKAVEEEAKRENN
jgi:hypothetical protein